MSLPWRKDKRPHLQLVRIEKKLDELIQLERGLIPISNDPTEIESQYRFIAPAHLRVVSDPLMEGEPKRPLHSWEAIWENEDGNLQCVNCKVLMSDCGATGESWYCE
jgi:hypothetical protein